MVNYYELLEIEPSCSFSTLKKAYYRKAKTCHPDLFGNSEEKKRQFQLLVDAFNILSDAERRRDYDTQLHIVNQTIQNVRSHGNTIMDSDSDDTLEELIVGNKVPENATLLTLFLDLERTHVFMTWREAHYFYSIRRYHVARDMFLKLIRMAPQNILYRVYLARCYAALGVWGKAVYFYRTALGIGRHRDPPQQMLTVQKELDNAYKKRHPKLHKFLQFFRPVDFSGNLTVEERMIQETNHAIAGILKEDTIQSRKRLK